MSESTTPLDRAKRALLSSRLEASGDTIDIGAVLGALEWAYRARWESGAIRDETLREAMVALAAAEIVVLVERIRALVGDAS